MESSTTEPIDTKLLKRKPDGVLDIAGELRESASYLRVACPDQRALIRHIEYLADQAEARDDL